MTAEEVNRTIEFIIQNSAEVSAHLAEASIQIEQNAVGLKELRESTARFQAWATEVVAIQSTRLDQNDKRLAQNDERLEQNDQLRQDMLELQRQALRLLNRILDKL